MLLVWDVVPLPQSLEIGHFHVENANLEKVIEAIEKKWKAQ